MEYENFEDVLKETIREKAIMHLTEAYAEYGLEGREDKIKELYANHEGTRDYLLKLHYERINGRV